LLRLLLIPTVFIAIFFPASTRAEPSSAPRQEAPLGRKEALTALVAAYPDFLDKIEGNALVWKDGSRMPIDDGRGEKSFDALLDAPDIKDMFVMTYPMGASGTPPADNADPGRIRYMPLFEKMYGDCRRQDVMANAVDVVWLPTKYGKKLKFSKINGAAAALQAASNELDALPDALIAYLKPSAGTYNCRVIAGTNRLSAHGLGVAIDISTAHAHYWRSARPDASRRYPYHNEIPWEIVKIFENHGFIWGGKWYHYDTMHFEYRPEILGVTKPSILHK
jgi:hypothetical protein